MTVLLRPLQLSGVLLILLSLIMPAAASSQALEFGTVFTPKLTQYAHTAWRLGDSLFTGVPTTVAQTSDGYIWVGTESGLVRFDGIQFIPVGDSSLVVYSLLGSRNGGLWVGTRHGVERVGGVNLPPVPKLQGRVNGMAEDADGDLWLARTRVGAGDGPLCRINGTQSRCFGPADGFLCLRGQAVIADAAMGVWTSDGRDLCKFSDHPQKIPIPGSGGADAAETISNTIVSNGSGGVLVGMDVPVKGTLLNEFESGHWLSVPVPELDKFGSDIETLVRARDGSIWAGTTGNGIFHVHNGKADHFGSADGLSGNSVSDILQDKEGSIWVVTSNGVDRFDVPKVLTFSTREGLLSDQVESVATGQNGDVWVATDGGLIKMHGEQLSAWTTASGLPGSVVSSMLVDRKGNQWLGVNSDLYHFVNGRFNRVKAPDNLRAGAIQNIVEDTSGVIWVSLAAKDAHLLKVTDANTLGNLCTSPQAASLLNKL